jgi:hypothetical protein
MTNQELEYSALKILEQQPDLTQRQSYSTHQSLLGLYSEYLVLQTTTNRVDDFDVHFSVVTFSEL